VAADQPTLFVVSIKRHRRVNRLHSHSVIQIHLHIDFFGVGTVFKKGLNACEQQLAHLDHLISLSLALLQFLAQRDRESADLGLGEAKEHLVVNCARKSGAIKLGGGQRDVKLDHRVDVGVGAVGGRRRLDVLQLTCLPRISQRLDHEAYEGLLNGHEPNGLELAQAQAVDDDIEVLFFDHFLHLQGHEVGASCLVAF